MKPDEVPDDLVEQAGRAYASAPQKRDGKPTRMRYALAAVLPAYTAQVMRNVTKKHWGDTLDAIVNDSFGERRAELVKEIRAKVADEIEANSNGTPSWQAAMLEAAEIARGEAP